ncbi:rCG34767 [Rattus norvegicus]|uniref:RCG34767 n=1 Tax=Rattus norvegicus TaxID=10116 RepID=A6HFB4_RAT|nr:rCG34767 [Rattus norvegicus]
MVLTAAEATFPGVSSHHPKSKVWVSQLLFWTGTVGGPVSHRIFCTI